ncbi:MAG: hypothetical protein HY062_12500 [Bacteroidetes bacterium]|nr:hypothetical protein [Bacteroidota bacterium]
MNEILINIIGTILGGLILTLVLFLLNEYIFPKHNLTGEWKTIIKIKSTTYKPFNNLRIEYSIHLLQKNNEILGSGEKIKDIKVDGKETIFLRENRVLINIDGYFDRKFFSNSIIYMNINEEGRKRKTRATYFLALTNKNTLIGTFISTSGDSSGEIIMTKSQN